MTDTAQPATAAETVVASNEDPFAAGAEAFKVALGQAEAPEPRRDDKGRFAAEQIEAEAEAAQAPEAAESHDEEQDGNEAADEAQHKDPTMPESWPADKAEVWQSLEPDAQAFIRQRDDEQKAAINVKFMEAANVRKAGEAQYTAAQSIHQSALHGLDLAMQVLQPQEPSISMLDINSSDYDPDSYHLAKAQYQHSLKYLNDLANQRQNLVAQAEQDARNRDAARLHQINEATAPAFVKEVPDAADPAKLQPLLRGLADYAIKAGLPADVFDGSETALEWHMLWKAREYDRMLAAKAKVQTDPRPEPRRASPPVRPGVATPPSAKAAARRQGAMDRLAKSGSIEDGAAVFKQIFKG
jgi:hypothetical protein